MVITLPDRSIASLDVSLLRFRQVGNFKVETEMEAETVSKAPAPFQVDFEGLSRCMSNPTWKFGDCFKRVSDHPRYSPRSSFHAFDITFLCRIYDFPGNYQGGTFSSSTTEWRFLDGGIISHNGYGWGSHSWTVVEGTEALRAICLFFGVAQPQKLKGESLRRPLALLLEEMTTVPLRESRHLG